MKVSIIVANYNYEVYLPLAIQSVLDQSYNDFEIIIVDDESTDKSRDIIQRLHSQYPEKITYIFQKNTGHGGAISTGFSAANGDIISFLDSDDLWDEHKLSRIMKVFQEDSTVMGVIHKLQVINKLGELGNSIEDVPKIPHGNLENLLIETGAAWFYPPTSAITIRRSVLETLLPVTSSEWKTSPDGCLMYGAGFLGKVIPIPEILGSYRLHGANTYARGKDEIESIEKQFDTLEKIEKTVQWINEFLSQINKPYKVNLSKNLNYIRMKYYLNGKFDFKKACEISVGIFRWKFYNPWQSIIFFLRFWMQNIFFITSRNGKT